MMAYDIVLPEPGVHIGLPSTTLPFVLPLGDPLDCGWEGEPSSQRDFVSCISGLHTAPARIQHDGVQRGVMLHLTPLGSRMLFGVPAAELAGHLVEIDDVAPALAHLPEQLAELATWPQRLARVQDRLLEMMARLEASGLKAEVGRALAVLAGNVPVAKVADEIGYSRRHLSTLFRAECGVSPKEYQRIARFQRAVQSLESAVGTGRYRLADVAASCGYADQAHLTREWRQLAGVTPTAWLRAEFPYRQDLEQVPA